MVRRVLAWATGFRGCWQRRRSTCLVLGERLRQQLPHALVLDDPVTANARGLARAAQRMFK